MSSDESKSAPEPSAGDATQAPPPSSADPSWATRYGHDDIFGAAAYEFLAPPQAKDEIGRLGAYRVLQVLGAGGMGLVFLAEDVHLKRRVALKVMRPEIAAGAEARQRFLREAQATAAIEHDHIITIYHVGDEGGVPYLAMPLLQGETLHDRLKLEGSLPPAEALRIAREAALGLAAAHERGLIHRDIKPSNIFLVSGGVVSGGVDSARTTHDSPLTTHSAKVKILDFGLARLTGDDPVTALTQKGALLGTPAYMAPEQAHGGDVDARADLFSLGGVFYEMLTGAQPFQGPNVMSVLKALTAHEPAPPHTLDPAVPLPMSELVMKLLAKEPTARPQSARAVAEALGAMAERRPPVAQAVTAVAGKRIHKEFEFGSPTTVVEIEPAPLPLAASPRQRRHWPLAAALGGTLILVVAIVCVVYFNRAPQAGKQPDRPTPPAPAPVAKKETPNFALEFDGVSSYVEIPPVELTETLGGPETRTITLEATVSVASHVPEHNRFFVHGPLRLGHFGLRQAWRVWANTGQKSDVYADSDGPVELGRKSHVAAVYDGKALRLYINGKMQYEPRRSWSWVEKKDQAAPEEFAAELRVPRTTIGAGFDGSNSQKYFFHGTVDEVRISKSARYAKDKDFVPPNRFEPDADTLALYHFDEGQGEKINDASPHRRHGKIVGAKWVRVEDGL